MGHPLLQCTMLIFYLPRSVSRWSFWPRGGACTSSTLRTPDQKKTFLNYIIGDQVVIKACCDRRSFYVPILNVNISYNNLFWSFLNGSERIQNKIFKVFIPEHCGASCARRRGCVVGRAQPQRCPQGSGCYPRGLWNQGIQT